MRIIKNFKLFEKFSSNILTKTLSYIKEHIRETFISNIKKLSRERNIPLSEITDESFVYSSVSEAKEEFSDILGAVFFLISDEGLRIEIVEPRTGFQKDGKCYAIYDHSDLVNKEKWIIGELKNGIFSYEKKIGDKTIIEEKGRHIFDYIIPYDYELVVKTRRRSSGSGTKDDEFCITYIPNKEELGDLKNIRNFRRERKPEKLSDHYLSYNNKGRYIKNIIENHLKNGEYHKIIERILMGKNLISNIVYRWYEISNSFYYLSNLIAFGIDTEHIKQLINNIDFSIDPLGLVRTISKEEIETSLYIIDSIKKMDIKTDNDLRKLEGKLQKLHDFIKDEHHLRFHPSHERIDKFVKELF